MVDENNYQSSTSNNYGYNSFSALQMRLGDTERIIGEVDCFLSGERIVIRKNAEGELEEVRVSVSDSKANANGIFAILNYLRTIINPHVVQGNFMLDGLRSGSSMYDNYICDTRINLVFMLIANQYEWEIRDKDINTITNSIMNIVEPFMSRLIDNKERESYESTMRHIESNNTREVQQKNSIFGNR